MKIKELRRNRLAIALDGNNPGHLLLGLAEDEVVCLSCGAMVKETHGPKSITMVQPLPLGTQIVVTSKLPVHPRSTRYIVTH